MKKMLDIIKRIIEFLVHFFQLGGGGEGTPQTYEKLKPRQFVDNFLPPPHTPLDMLTLVM